jgi:hypothetical protein
MQPPASATDTVSASLIFIPHFFIFSYVGLRIQIVFKDSGVQGIPLLCSYLIGL